MILQGRRVAIRARATPAPTATAPAPPDAATAVARSRWLDPTLASGRCAGEFGQMAVFAPRILRGDGVQL